MQIKKLNLENIRSYENVEIAFPSGSVLLSGDIGSGKSSVLLAVEFALFGLQRGVSGASLLRSGADKGRVQLELVIDGKEIIIERTLRRSKSGIVQDSSYITIDGERKELSTTELKQRILQLLNYPAEFLTKNPVLYRYTVYTPQEQMKQILLEDIDERLNTLRRVFGIDRYKRIVENVEIFSTKLRERIKGKEGAISGLEDKKSELLERKKISTQIEGALKALLPSLKNAKAAVAEKKEAVSRIEQQLQKLNKLKTDLALAVSQLESKKEQRNKIAADLRSIKEQITRLSTQLKEITIKPGLETKLPAEIKKKEAELAQAEQSLLKISNKIAQLETKKAQIEQLQKDIERLAICPTCKQQVTPEHKELVAKKAQADLSVINSDLEKSTNGRKETEKELNYFKIELKKLQEQERVLEKAKLILSSLEEKRTAYQKLQKEDKKLGEQIAACEKRAIELRQNSAEFKGAEEQYKKARSELDEALEQEKQLAVKHAQLTRQRTDLAEVMTGLAKEIDQKEQAKKELEQLTQLRSWLAQHLTPLTAIIEKTVMAKLNVEFNALFAKWFSMLVAEAPLAASLDENFTPRIEQAGHELDYAYLSGGERTAAALAYRLALNQVVNSIMSRIKTRDLLILDEPTDGFSSEQLDRMRDVLADINATQLILVSHEVKIEGFVDNVIKFSKERSISSVA